MSDRAPDPVSCDEWELDVIRQFSFVDENGEYEHVAQLNCTFDFEHVEELKAAGSGSEWSFRHAGR